MLSVDIKKKPTRKGQISGIMQRHQVFPFICLSMTGKVVVGNMGKLPKFI